jgi:hypothetical protein
MDFYYTKDLCYLTGIFITPESLMSMIKQTTTEVYCYFGLISTCLWSCTRLTDGRFRLLVTFERNLD